MTVSIITAVLSADIDTVWGIVTDAARYTEWRGGLERVEVLDELNFVEYDRVGFATAFSVTQRHAPELWEFSMDNANMSGRWQGEFKPVDSGTEVRFTEYMQAKRFVLRPFVRPYLRKQQRRFVAELKQRLNCERRSAAL